MSFCAKKPQTAVGSPLSARTVTVNRTRVDGGRQRSDADIASPDRNARQLRSLRYHSRGDSGGVRFRDLQDIRDPRDLHDSYVVLGGGRGLEVLSDYVLQVMPPWAREMTAQPSSAPASWDRLLTVEGSTADATRRFDLVIFRVP